MSWDWQSTSTPRFRLVGVGPAQFRPNNTGCIDTHHYFSQIWTRLWCVFIDQVIWTATAMDTDRFHVLVSFLRVSRGLERCQEPSRSGQANSSGTWSI